MTNQKQNKICIITTVDFSLDCLFPDYYHLLLAEGYRVTGICAETLDGSYSDNVRKQSVEVINVPMARHISILQDLKCLWMLFLIFRKEKFDIIHYSTPKASFLAAIAGRLAGGSFLLYTLRGQGYMSVEGLKRSIAKFCEQLACRLAHRVIVISKSLKDEAVREKLLSENKAEVLGSGSSKGVNLEQFSLTPQIKSNSEIIRQELNISKKDIVVGCAGRLTKEKGIHELVEAFRKLSQRFGNLHLILIGDQDHRIPLEDDVLEKIAESRSIHQIDFTQEFPSYLAALDIFVLPSYREGFGNVIIEASAMKLPVIASDIPGCRDTLVDGTTGILIRSKDISSLEKALTTLIENPSERERLGNNGFNWIRDNFDRRVVWEKLLDIYGEILPRNSY